MDKTKLKQAALEIRKGIVTEVFSASSGHPGGSLSIADILAYLFFEEMNVNPENPEDSDSPGTPDNPEGERDDFFIDDTPDEFDDEDDDEEDDEEFDEDDEEDDDEEGGEDDE